MNPAQLPALAEMRRREIVAEASRRGARSRRVRPGLRARIGRLLLRAGARLTGAGAAAELVLRVAPPRAS